MVKQILCELFKGNRNLIRPSLPLSRLFYEKSNFVQQLSPFCQQATGNAVHQDKIDTFFDPNVQNLLKELTGADYKKIFRKRKVGQKLKDPKYQFMTEEQLEAAINTARENASKLLQMPPVCRPRKAIDKVLSFDPYLQGYENYTLIFTDITLGISDRNRLIVSRDPDGTLRHASWEEREKMNSIYFPTPGKELHIPLIFSDATKLQQALDNATPEDNKYEIILDRACLQFEPDDPIYISAVEKTYEIVDQRRHYDYLKSTRHYGPMVFHLVRTRRMDNLLQFNILEKRISSDVMPLLSLFHLMYPDSKSKVESRNVTDDIEKIRKYIELDCSKRSELELVLNAYAEAEKNRVDHEEGLKHAHGLQ